MTYLYFRISCRHLTPQSWTGVAQVQTYLFYRRFPEDPYVIKLLVAVLWYSPSFLPYP
ncbi:hypothetical protein DL93DRAFT_490634 [Clavulina sp. PMI_390]|nr:hypothetical protein DL93DRAFT_490634 [Clavulina sp. PMI_390]